MNISDFLQLVPRVSIIKSIYFSLRFKGVIVVGHGCNINIHSKAKIVFSEKKSSLYIGIYFSLAQGSTLDIYKNGILIVGKSVGIHRGTKVVIRENAKLSIGNKSFVNENSRIQCRKNIYIGQDVSIGWGCMIVDSDFHGIYIDGDLSNQDLPVKICDKVWICSNVTITKGVVIDYNCIVGISSVVVNAHLKSNCIYAGNPLRVVKKFEYWGNL